MAANVVVHNRFTAKLAIAHSSRVIPMANSSSRSELVASGIRKRPSTPTMPVATVVSTVVARNQPTIQTRIERRWPSDRSWLSRRAWDGLTSSNKTSGSAKNQPVNKRSSTPTSPTRMTRANAHGDEKNGRLLLQIVIDVVLIEQQEVSGRGDSQKGCNHQETECDDTSRDLNYRPSIRAGKSKCPQHSEPLVSRPGAR